MFRTLLIANRGEIAIRIARSAAELGIESIAIHAADEAEDGQRPNHALKADRAVALPGNGVSAYLDSAAIIAAAKAAGAQAVHPGYGFLSEHAGFARACAAAGLIFVGPAPEQLDILGDKARARLLAQQCGVPLLAGTAGDTPQGTSLAEALLFLESLGPGGAVMVKARAGGGGRGMRPVYGVAELEPAYILCAAEARKAFGDGALYVERLMPGARHIEVQVLGDGSGAVNHLWERECSLQRQRQKLIEIAPAPGLDPALRARLIEDALTMAAALRYRGLGTVEFLVGADGSHAFIEANPRLQVEHTVTEAITGLDLVALQLHIAAGASLADLGLAPQQAVIPRGMAMQLRINAETLLPDGGIKPAAGRIGVFEPAAGRGIRVDSAAHAGYRVSGAYDSLLAKLIVHSDAEDFPALAAKALRALRETRIAGVAHNMALLGALLRHPRILAGGMDTGFVERHLAALLTAPDAAPLHAALAAIPQAEDTARLQNIAIPDGCIPDGCMAVLAPLQGKLAALPIAAGQPVAKGQVVAVLEAMKMEHALTASHGGVLREILLQPGDVAREGEAVLLIAVDESAAAADAAAAGFDPDHIRPDLSEVIARHALTSDAARPEAVARRHGKGMRTARENIAALCDEGSFIEYGALAVAAQRRRRDLDDLMRNTPADGFICGIGAVNGDAYPEQAARCAVMAYDFTVLAGTQGMMGHKKLDRMLDVALHLRLPTVLFAEGGGGRPGDTDANTPAGLDLHSFRRFAQLSGDVPLLGIVAGRCFAGNAALLGCCDTIIATEDANIGMGGPAMIEGGGLGVYPPEAVGPVSVQRKNGVVDIAVRDEAEAVSVAKKYLSYFQGARSDWQAGDPRLLRGLIPENRLRVYDIRAVIDALADTDSVLELRRDFGCGMVTALIRIEGRPMGLIANDPRHLGGAIDADAADKAARFLQLCAMHGLPILSLCDTPGFMVGPEIETKAQVRHVSRMFVVGANIDVPIFALVLRKGYGLGAMAMTGGGFHASVFTASWPTGEFGGMGLEGAVRLGYRKELEAAPDDAARGALYRQLLEKQYEQGKATSMASFLEIDAVIDPAESRSWIIRGLRALPPDALQGGTRRFVDTW